MDFHLIHREAVPLPLKGKDLSVVEVEAGLRMSGSVKDLIHRKRSPFSYKEKALKREEEGEVVDVGAGGAGAKQAAGFLEEVVGVVVL